MATRFPVVACSVGVRECTQASHELVQATAALFLTGHAIPEVVVVVVVEVVRLTLFRMWRPNRW